MAAFRRQVATRLATATVTVTASTALPRRYISSRRSFTPQGGKEPPSVWHKLWDSWSAASPPPFHLKEVNPNLVQWYTTWLQAAGVGDGTERLPPVFVPLCGKSLDLAYLASLGHQVVGLELMDEPAQQLRDEQVPDLQLVEYGTDGAPLWMPRRWHSQSTDITVCIGDWMAEKWQRDPHMDVVPSGGFRLLWDRAGITSVAPSHAQHYLRALYAITAPGGAVLMETMTPDGPHQCHDADGLTRAVQTLFDVHLLRSHDVTHHYPAGQYDSLVEHVCLLVKPLEAPAWNQ